MSDRDTMFDVAVIGAGPSGLTAANLLAGAGVRVLVVERNQGTVQQPRAVSIDDEALRTMQAGGMVEEVMADLALDYGSDLTGPGGEVLYRVNPTTREYGFPRRSAVVQPILEATLRTAFQRRPGVEALFGWSCSGVRPQADHVALDLIDGQQARREVLARYIVGADGGRSFLREVIGARLEGETYSQRWLIVDIEQTKDLLRQSIGVSDPERPLVNLPGPDGRRRFEFMLHPHEKDEDVTDEGFVRDLLSRHGPDRDAPIVRRQVYTFHARVVDKWQEGRIFLIGDAAHLTPPFAGQGMNSGVRDAHNIAWKLAAVVKGEMGAALLDTYQLEREPHARALIALAVRNGRLLMTRPGLPGLLTRARYRIAGRIPAIARYYRQMKNKPKAAYVRGFVLPDAESVWTGGLFVQPRLEKVDRSCVLMDEMIGSRFAIIAVGAEAQAAVVELQRQDWGLADPCFLAISPWNYNLRRDLPGVAAGRDIDNILQLEGEEPTRVIVMRPDRYVLVDGLYTEAGAALASRTAAIMESTFRSPTDRTWAPTASSRGGENNSALGRSSVNTFDGEETL